MDHRDLTDQQRDLLAEMYAECNETLDALPYTDKFETLYNGFMRRANLEMDRHSFWRALSNARKASRLVRKERNIGPLAARVLAGKIVLNFTPQCLWSLLALPVQKQE